jgi:hypothetical protein
LLDQLDDLAIVDAVAPIQLAIRLLVTAESALLELPDLRDALDPFDPASLTWPWRHADARVDALQREVMAVVGSRQEASRRAVFDEIVRIARDHAGGTRPSAPQPASGAAACCGAASVPHLTEAWYCCAEPAGCDGTGTPGPEHQDAAYASEPAATSRWQAGP